MHLRPTTIPHALIHAARHRRSVAVALLLTACDASVTDTTFEDLEFRSESAASLMTLSLGSTTTCVTTVAGDAKCWGLNDHGQLGRADVISVGDDESPSEMDFIDLGGAAVDVKTNGLRSFALLDDGRVLAWGDNTDAALGLEHYDTIGDDEAPSGAEVEIGGWATELAVGEDFACALLHNGLMRCWGANDFGQLGRAHTDRIGDDEAPEDEPAVWLGAPIESIAAGRHHVCALHGAGSVRCWGRNDHGQLGIASTENVGDDEHPVLMADVELSGPAVQVVAGGHHTCAVMASGTMQCWGDNSSGQLGHGHDKGIGDDETPAAAGAVPVGGTVVSASLGREHTCALLDTGALNCFGRGDLGQLGRGSTKSVGVGQTAEEAGVLDLGGLDVLEIHGGPLTNTTCAVFSDQNLRCWGDNDQGQQGYGHQLRWGGQKFETPGTVPDIVVYEDDDDS